MLGYTNQREKNIRTNQNRLIWVDQFQTQTKPTETRVNLGELLLGCSMVFYFFTFKILKLLSLLKEGYDRLARLSNYIIEKKKSRKEKNNKF